MFLDARRSEYVSIHRSIPLIYAPYLGAHASQVYVLYVALAGSEGHAEVSEGDICRFLGIDQQSLEQAHTTLESYNLIQLKRESVSTDGFICRLLPPPPLPEHHSEDFESRSLPVETGAVLPKPTSPKRATKRSGPTPARLISKFYRGIHQPKIDSAEREMAKAEVADLRTTYSLEDIDFAIQWTLDHRELLVQPVESFAIIRDTIDQALASREQAETERVHSQVDTLVEEDHRRKQQEMLQKFRETLSGEQLKEIRQTALAQIEEDDSIVQELVTESFIRIKEDAIILEEYMKDSFEPD